MSMIHEAQRMVYEQLQQEVAQFKDHLDRNALPAAKSPEGKGIVRAAQNYKYQAKRIARLAYAVEVLESCDPHYPCR